MTRDQRIGGLNHRNEFSHSSGGWKSKIKMSAGLLSCRRSLLQTACRWLSSHCIFSWPSHCPYTGAGMAGGRRRRQRKRERAPTSLPVFLFFFFFLFLKGQQSQGLPGGPVVENPPSHAGDVDLILGWGTTIAHATGQLSLRTARRNPCGATEGHKRRNQRNPVHHNKDPVQPKIFIN